VPIPIQDIDFSALSASEKLELASTLLDSVLTHDIDPFSPEQLSELDRRVNEIETGKIEFEPWSTVRQRLLKPQ
jgi:putative addiction module component (TIGR02574 family)